jgi:hypothetical protein
LLSLLFSLLFSLSLSHVYKHAHVTAARVCVGCVCACEKGSDSFAPSSPTLRLL